MNFSSDKEFSKYIERSVSKKVEKHFDAVGTQVIEQLLSEMNDVPFSQKQIDFMTSLAHNYGKVGAKFGALTALEIVQELNQPR